MKVRLILIVLLGTLFSSYGANAEICAQKENTLDVVEEESDGSIRVEVSGHEGQCSCDVFRFSSTDVDAGMVLLSLLNAKENDHKVQIDLSESGNCDSAYGVFDSSNIFERLNQVSPPRFN